MSEDQTTWNVKVVVDLPRLLVERMTGPWYLLKKAESDRVREMFREALNQDDGGSEEPSGFKPV